MIITEVGFFVGIELPFLIFFLIPGIENSDMLVPLRLFSFPLPSATKNELTRFLDTMGDLY